MSRLSNFPVGFYKPGHLGKINRDVWSKCPGTFLKNRPQCYKLLPGVTWVTQWGCYWVEGKRCAAVLLCECLLFTSKSVNENCRFLTLIKYFSVQMQNWIQSTASSEFITWPLWPCSNLSFIQNDAVRGTSVVSASETREVDLAKFLLFELAPFFTPLQKYLSFPLRGSAPKKGVAQSRSIASLQ